MKEPEKVKCEVLNSRWAGNHVLLEIVIEFPLSPTKEKPIDQEGSETSKYIDMLSELLAVAQDYLIVKRLRDT